MCFPWSQLYRFQKLTHLTLHCADQLLNCFAKAPAYQLRRVRHLYFCCECYEEEHFDFICDNLLLLCPDLETLQFRLEGETKIANFFKLQQNFLSRITINFAHI